MKLNENVGKIKSFVNGYKASYIIMAAVRLGIFNVLSDCPKSAQEIAVNMQLEERKIEPILNALAHFGLIDKENNGFALTEYSDVLCPHSPLSQLGYIDHAYNMTKKWSAIENVIKNENVSEVNFGGITGGDINQTRAFLNAMNTNAITQAKFLVQNYDFANHNFIDIGAGYGTYSFEIAKKYPTSMGVAFDLPIAISIIEENIKKENLNCQITAIPGNYKTYLPEGPFDDALLFAVVHQENEVEVNKLLKKVYNLLNVGGKLYLTSFFVDDSRIEPEFSVLFGVEMLVGSKEGRVYSHNEIFNFLRNAGFNSVECVTQIPGPATLYIAEK